jgi:RNA recognition motif-containing protein
MNIYVGNIPLNASVAEVKNLFESFGTIVSLQIIMDRGTGQSKGFAFVEMIEDEAGEQAIVKLNNMNFMGHYLEVQQVRERPEVRLKHSS